MDQALAATWDLLAPLFGPNGQHHALALPSGTPSFPHNAADVLSSAVLSHPAAALLRRAAGEQYRLAGDGTALAVLLCLALLPALPPRAAPLLPRLLSALPRPRLPAPAAPLPPSPLSALPLPAPTAAPPLLLPHAFPLPAGLPPGPLPFLLLAAPPPALPPALPARALLCPRPSPALRSALSAVGVAVVEVDVSAAAAALDMVPLADLPADLRPHVRTFPVRSVQGASLLVHPSIRGSTLILRGPDPALRSRQERRVRDQIRVASRTQADGLVVPGGGAFEALMAASLREFDDPDPLLRLVAHKVGLAFQKICELLVQNTGHSYSPAFVESWISASNIKDGDYYALQFLTADGRLETLRDSPKPIYDSIHVKQSAVAIAFETASLILSIDSIVTVSSVRPPIPSAQPLSTDPSNHGKAPRKYRNPHSRFRTSEEWDSYEKARWEKKEERFYSKEATEKRRKIEAILSGN